MREGETVLVFDGHGTEAEGSLRFIESEDAFVQIESIRYCDRESPAFMVGLAVTDSRDELAQAIRSVVQLGVDRIALIVSRYCGFRKITSVDRYMNRWKNIIVSAAKQCGQNWLPDLTGPENLESLIKSLEFQRSVFIGWASDMEECSAPPVDAMPGPEGYAWIVGPEGGWSEEERLMMLEHRVRLLRLGRLVFTSDVAAITGIAALRTMAGSWIAKRGSVQ